MYPSASAAPTAGITSRTVRIGKRMPCGLPVLGSIDAGPVVTVCPSFIAWQINPWAAITKNRSVSMGLPDPIMPSQ